MANVDIYAEQKLTAEQILEFEIPNLVLATGATWRRDGTGRENQTAIAGLEAAKVFTPDDIMANRIPNGQVIIFDDDHYYMGGVLAEKLALEGCEVTIVTPLPLVSNWTENTLEQEGIQARLLEMGVEIVANHNLSAVGRDSVELSCRFTDRRTTASADAVVLVTALSSNNRLETELRSAMTERESARSDLVASIGDCEVPGTIAAAVYSGHKFAREFREPRDVTSGHMFARELPGI